MAPSRYDWKIVDWDVKPQHNQHNQFLSTCEYYITTALTDHIPVPLNL